MLLKTSHDLKKRADDSHARTVLYGPPPVNPFRELREQAGLTLGDVANYTKVDRRALQRCEHGMYTNPLPSLVSYWVRLNRASEGGLLNGYADYQDNQRLRHKLYFGPSLAVSANEPGHPFRQLRANRPSLVNNSPLPVGLTEVCQALCLPLDSLQFFEKKFRIQKSVPKNLINVLNQIGYNRDAINSFEQVYSEWRERNRTIKFS